MQSKLTDSTSIEFNMEVVMIIFYTICLIRSIARQGDYAQGCPRAPTTDLDSSPHHTQGYWTVVDQQNYYTELEIVPTQMTRVTEVYL